MAAATDDDSNDQPEKEQMDESTVDNDNEKKGEEEPTRRSWTVKRVLSNDSFRRENPGQVAPSVAPGSNVVDEKEDLNFENGNENDDQEHAPKRSYKVKRIMSQDSFRKENPDATLSSEDDELSDPSLSVPDTLPVTEEEKDGAPETENVSPRRSWTVKRVISNDSFRRENPGMAPETGSSSSLPNPSEEDDDGDCNDVDHKRGQEDDLSPRRSWKAKRVVSNEAYWKENADMMFVDFPSNSLHDSRHSVPDTIQEESEEEPVEEEVSKVEPRWSSKANMPRPTRRGTRISLEVKTTHTYKESPRRHSEASSDSKNALFSKTSHLPLKKRWQIGSPLEKESIRSYSSEDSSECGLALGTTHHSANSTQSNDSFASIFADEEDDEVQEELSRLKRLQDDETFRNENPDVQMMNEPMEQDGQSGEASIEAVTITPQSSPQRRSTLTGRINMFEMKSEKEREAVTIGGVLSPRHAPKQSKRSTSTDSAYITSPMRSSRVAHRASSTGSSPEGCSASDGSSVDETEAPGTPRASNAQKSPAPSVGSSLKDRIGMFNKNAKLPEFMVIGSSPTFGAKKLVARQSASKSTGTLPECKPAQANQKNGLPPKPIAKVSRLDTKRTSLKDLLPPPKKSLDVKNTEYVQRKLEKMSSFHGSANESFNRRGRLKATRSALLGKKDPIRRDIFMPVSAPQMDVMLNFEPPTFKKDFESVNVIALALRKNFVFNEMNEEDTKRFINAFEQVTVDKGETIIRQGDVGDFFYVVAYGEVSFHVNNRKVGSAGSGSSFGEMSLLYSCPRAATCIADTPTTRLFRVDQKTFRCMMQSQTKESEKKKQKLLHDIKFLEHLSHEDFNRLCSVMTPCVFGTGDYIVKKGERGDSFYVIQEGKVRVTDIVVGKTRYEDVTLEAGDYFGEGALISSEDRAANVVALTKGAAFAIDRKTFQRVLGDFVKVIGKAQDRRRLVSNILCVCAA